MSKRMRTDRTARRRGFTLIELLVVMGVIALLASILIPTLMAVLRRDDASKTQARVTQLNLAAMEFKVNQGDNRYYPGQRQWSQLGADETGSQALARSIFVDEKGNFPGGRLYQQDDLFTFEGKADTISDGNTKPMAICYYPSRPGQSDGKPDVQYREGHNSVYTNGHKDGNFNSMITDPRNTNLPYRAGMFLLIAPGPDRKYFTEDDITNFGMQ